MVDLILWKLSFSQRQDTNLVQSKLKSAQHYSNKVEKSKIILKFMWCKKTCTTKTIRVKQNKMKISTKYKQPPMGAATKLLRVLL